MMPLIETLEMNLWGKFLVDATLKVSQFSPWRGYSDSFCVAIRRRYAVWFGVWQSSAASSYRYFRSRFRSGRLAFYRQRRRDLRWTGWQITGRQPSPRSNSIASHYRQLSRHQPKSHRP